MIGLIEADKSFDASKGVDFEIFAKNRIRGAISGSGAQDVLFATFGNRQYSRP